MTSDMVPKKKIGVFAPRALVEMGPYEFYQLAPKGIMLVIVPMGIRSFTKEGVEEVYKNIDQQLEELMIRRVDVIIQEGVPLQCLIGLEAHDRRLAYIREKTGLPVSSGVEGSVDAAKHLGIKKIAFANKFTKETNAGLAKFFERAGITVTGAVSWGEDKGDLYGMGIKKIADRDLVNIGFEVGRRAFRENPDCDGIYMPGGSWSLNKVVVDLEKEFGKPVLGHRHTTVWHMIQSVGMWKPRKGHGRLFAAP